MTAEAAQRVVVASLAEARAAIAAARLRGVVAELESPPDAAIMYGVLWFAEMNRVLLAEFPGASFTLTLDCGDRADLAHARRRVRRTRGVGACGDLLCGALHR